MLESEVALGAAESALGTRRRHWRDFERALEASGKAVFPSDAEALDRDRGRYIGFVRCVGRRTGKAGFNLYDPALGVEVGVD